MSETKKAIIPDNETHSSAHKIAELTLPSLSKFAEASGGNLLSCLWALSIMRGVLIKSAVEDGMTIPAEIVAKCTEALSQACVNELFEKLSDSDSLAFLDFPEELIVDVDDDGSLVMKKPEMN